MKSVNQILVILMMLYSCKEKASKQNEVIPNKENEAVKAYANMVLVSYEDVIKSTKLLQVAIEGFAIDPNLSKFENCKEAWLAARIPYGQTEAYRFYGGPIDGEDGPEGFINAWPLDESYIDYVEGNNNAGIINNLEKYPIITEDLLKSLNEKNSETNIATGYHAIEFLLWGQDFYTDSPGKRFYTDFQKGTTPNAERRLTYLRVSVNLLIKDLEFVRNQWLPSATWCQQFVNPNNSKESLRMIFEGIGKLSKGELAGERMIVALENKDQEDEHSCFSDNTLTDIKMNYLGIKNVYLSSYITTGGQKIVASSLSDLVKTKNVDKDKKVLDALTHCEYEINAIPYPFDQAIVNDQEKIIKAINSLKKLSDFIADAGFSLGLQINTSLD